MVGVGKPKIFLGMPQCGSIEPEAAHAFFNASYSADLRIVDIVRQQINTSSFLPGNFNSLLAQALDMRDNGEVSHFAMMHADISPPSWWLSDMYHELITRNAEVVSAVIAIKSRDRNDDKTSTAVGRIDKPWDVQRYIHVSDLPELPATFGAHNVCKEPGECLLINTGLWLADLNAQWWDDFEGFTTFARIDRREKNRVSQWRTEDWEFSRFLASQNARYYATTRIAADHLGTDRWKIR